MAATNELIRQAQGLAFDVAHMSPSSAGSTRREYAATVSGRQMAMDARERWQQSLEALRTTTGAVAGGAQNRERRTHAHGPG